MQVLAAAPARWPLSAVAKPRRPCSSRLLCAGLWRVWLLHPTCCSSCSVASCLAACCKSSSSGCVLQQMHLGPAPSSGKQAAANLQSLRTCCSSCLLASRSAASSASTTSQRLRLGPAPSSAEPFCSAVAFRSAGAAPGASARHTSHQFTMLPQTCAQRYHSLQAGLQAAHIIIQVAPASSGTEKRTTAGKP